MWLVNPAITVLDYNYTHIRIISHPMVLAKKSFCEWSYFSIPQYRPSSTFNFQFFIGASRKPHEFFNVAINQLANVRVPTNNWQLVWQWISPTINCMWCLGELWLHFCSCNSHVVTRSVPINLHQGHLYFWFQCTQKYKFNAVLPVTQSWLMQSR